MSIPQNIKEEWAAVSRSASLREDMRIIAQQKYIPFLEDGKTDVDAYLAFVTEFNEFINHEPKPFRKISDREMVL